MYEVFTEVLKTGEDRDVRIRLFTMLLSHLNQLIAHRRKARCHSNDFSQLCKCDIENHRARNCTCTNDFSLDCKTRIKGFGKRKKKQWVTQFPQSTSPWQCGLYVNSISYLRLCLHYSCRSHWLQDRTSESWRQEASNWPLITVMGPLCSPFSPWQTARHDKSLITCASACRQQ